ncbi:MAG: hypothetical protein K2P51_08255 [Rhabdochlamydiaceae bacterium]|nr:hypothetical protein [Rhabdochlamydiaceae bacterium]
MVRVHQVSNFYPAHSSIIARTPGRIRPLHFHDLRHQFAAGCCGSLAPMQASTH